MRNGLLNIHRPADHDEALSLAVTHGSGASFYSGGVHLVPTMRDGTFATETLIDVKHLPGSRDVTSDTDEVVIGAAITYRELGYSRHVVSAFPSMATGIFRIGNPRVRAVGTVGGGLAVRASESDIALLLAAHDAQIVARRPGGERRYPVESWLEEPDGIELLTQIRIPKRRHRVAYHRFPHYGAPLAVAVARRSISGSHERFEVIAGCTGTPPRRIDVTHLVSPEGGRTRTERETLAAMVSQNVSGVETPSASAEYRRHLAGVLANRSIDDLTTPVGSPSPGDVHEDQ